MLFRLRRHAAMAAMPSLPRTHRNITNTALLTLLRYCHYVAFAATPPRREDNNEYIPLFARLIDFFVIFSMIFSPLRYCRRRYDADAGAKRHAAATPLLYVFLYYATLFYAPLRRCC